MANQELIASAVESVVVEVEKRDNDSAKYVIGLLKEKEVIVDENMKALLEKELD